MKLLSLKNLFLLLCVSAPMIYLNMIYDDLPSKVAMHFGSDMKPDRYGDKSELWMAVCIMLGISIVVYLIITNIGKIDPKNQKLQSEGIMEKMGLAIVAFISVVTLYIIYSVSKGESGNLLFVLLGGFFAVLGNFLHNIKPNYFAGFRLPWTLEDEDNWRKTHQLGGKVWVAGGLLIVLIGLILPDVMSTVFFIILVTMVLIPCIFSYRYYIAKRVNQ